MPADLIETVVILFPNPEWTDSHVVSQLQPNASFAQKVEWNTLQQLSKGSTAGVDIRGFLYVPDLDPTDACFNTTNEYVPNNVTRIANLPHRDFTLIALAPWTSVQCTQAYLASAKSNPTRAFIFYLPEDASSLPPPPSSPVWNLGDDESWKIDNPYSVYAVSSGTGRELMTQLSHYSGNLTSVPHGHAISSMPGGDPRSYVRLYTCIRISTPTGMFRMWGFLLIVAAILVGMLSIMSFATKPVEKLRRKTQHQRPTNEKLSTAELDIEHRAIT